MANPRQFAVESDIRSIPLTIPSADYSAVPSAVQSPMLIEAAGLDGRFQGELRSFPGFAALGINETYEDVDGTALGPLLVGPGIDHTDDGVATSWKHWPLRLPKGQTDSTVKFFKYMEFKKTRTSSDIIYGFVMLLPYTGPTWDGVSIWNKGLPLESGTLRYVLVFLYWDQSDYTAPFSGATKGTGWRVRILNNTEPTSGNESYLQSIAGAVDTTYWDIFGYVAGAYYTQSVSGVWTQAYGSPNRVTALAEADDGEGPHVIYWDSDYNYIRVRPMGTNLPEAEIPIFVDPTDQTSPVNTVGDIEITSNPDNGLIKAIGAPSILSTGISFYNNTTKLRSDILLDRAVVLPADTRVYLMGRIAMHINTWDRFDTLEVWRSPIGVPGVLFKEHSIPLPTLPAFDTNKDYSTSYRTYIVTWGLGDTNTTTASAAAQADFTPGTYYRYDMVESGASDFELQMRDMYDGVWEFTDTPPTDGNKILVNQDVCIMIGGGFTQGKPYVKPRMRWSSLIVPRPENFSDVNSNFFPDEEVGFVYGVEKSGDTIFIPGTRSTLSVRRLGDRFAFSNIGENIAPVSRFAWTTGGSRLFVLTKEGLYIADGSGGSVQPIDSLVYEMLADERWGREILAEPEEELPSIGMTYDEAGDCLFIWNLNRLEAVVMYLKTGFVTKLHDFCWQLATQGQAPSQMKDGTSWQEGQRAKRAFFIAERRVQAGTNVNDPYLEIFYPDFAPDRRITVGNAYYTQRPVTMHGDPGILDEDSGASTFGRYEGVALNGDIDTVEADNATAQHESYIDIDTGSALSIPSKVLKRLQRRLVGGMIHLWSADGETHCRRQIHWFNQEVTGKIRVYLYPSLSATEATSLELGTYSICPVVVRVVPPLLQADGKRVQFISGSVNMDVLALRMANPGAGVVWVPTVDATAMKVFAVGYDEEGGDLDDPDTYGAYGTEDVTFDVGVNEISESMLLAYASPPPPGRLKEKERALVTPSRSESQSTFDVKFGAMSGTVGIEAYPAGALLSLKSLRINANIMPTVR